MKHVAWAGRRHGPVAIRDYSFIVVLTAAEPLLEVIHLKGLESLLAREVILLSRPQPVQPAHSIIVISTFTYPAVNWMLVDYQQRS